jgi:hypothetical protein
LVRLLRSRSFPCLPMEFEERITLKRKREKNFVFLLLGEVLIFL